MFNFLETQHLQLPQIDRRPRLEFGNFGRDLGPEKCRVAIMSPARWISFRFLEIRKVSLSHTCFRRCMERIVKGCKWAGGARLDSDATYIALWDLGSLRSHF